jgi:hypothetical protein
MKYSVNRHATNTSRLAPITGYSSLSAVMMASDPPNCKQMAHQDTWHSSSHALTNDTQDKAGIPRLPWNTKVHYHVHKTSLLDPILTGFKSVQNFTPYF